VYDLTISNNGLYEFGEGSQTTQWPSILIEVSATDLDGDLTTNILDVWYDLDADGVITSGSTQIINRPGTVFGEDCEVEATVLSSIIAVTGNPPMDSLVEFGAMVTDRNGNVSNGGVAYTTVFHTPDSSGNVPQ
jgi:hypothetical protein